MDIYIFRVSDSHGATSEAAVDDLSDSVQVCGLKDEAGNDTYFESDARHLLTWAAECDFMVERHVVDLSTDLMKVISWMVTFHGPKEEMKF